MPDRSKVYPAQIPPLPLRPSRSGMSKRTRKRMAYVLVGAIAAVVVAALLLAAFPPNKESLLKAGAVAPPFTLRTVSGTPVTLKGPVVLEFCSTWDPDCAQLVPALNRVAAHRRVLAVNADSENAASVASFIHAQHVRHPVLLDPGSRTVAFPTRGPRGPVTSRYRVTRFPTVYLIDAHGRVSGAVAGLAASRALLARLP
jgi:thiol-disulfide isomerase/thioredoxin